MPRSSTCRTFTYLLVAECSPTFLCKTHLSKAAPSQGLRLIYGARRWGEQMRWGPLDYCMMRQSKQIIGNSLRTDEKNHYSPLGGKHMDRVNSKWQYMLRWGWVQGGFRHVHGKSSLMKVRCARGKLQGLERDPKEDTNPTPLLRELAATPARHSQILSFLSWHQKYIPNPNTQRESLIAFWSWHCAAPPSPLG